MSRQTMIMAAAAALLFFLVLQDLRQAPEQEVGTSRFIFDLDTDTVTAITVLKNGEEHITAAKVNADDWMITAPVQAPASAFSFASIFNFIGSGMYLGTVPPPEDGNLAPFGLGTPPLTVMFTADGRSYAFDVSAVQDEKLFIRRHDKSDVIYSAPKHFYNFFNKDLADYRLRTVCSFNDVNVSRIECRGANNFLITKPSQDIWIIEEPFKWPGAPDIIAAYLGDLKALRVRDFVKDNASEEDLAGYGLTDASPAVTVTLNRRNAMTIEFGRADDAAGTRYFRMAGSTTVATVAEDLAARLLNADTKLFRNRDLAVFETPLVARITIDNLMDKSRIVLEREAVNAPWLCTFPENEKVGTERVNDFLREFKNARILNFAMEGDEMPAVFGLDAPDLIVTFSRKGKAGADEPMYRLNLKDKGQGSIYAFIDKQFYGSVSILQLPPELYRRLASGLASFRSLYLMLNAENRITNLAIEGTNRVRFECVLTRERRWEVVEPTDKLPDMPEITRTLDVLANLKAADIIASDDTALVPYGFDDPRAVITFTVDGRRFQILIGKNVPGTTHSYARMADGHIVYALAKEKVNELTKDTGLFIKIR